MDKQLKIYVEFCERSGLKANRVKNLKKFNQIVSEQDRKAFENVHGFNVCKN